MHELVNAFLDRYTELSRNQELDHASLLKEFAEPAYADFLALHARYVELYAGYHREVEQWNFYREQIGPFCERLRTDHLLTPAFQTKLWDFAHLDVRPVLRDFVGAIGAYFSGIITEIYRSECRFWIPPGLIPSVITKLKRLADDPATSEAELLYEVRTFVNNMFQYLAANKTPLAKAYDWQRTKLSR